MRDGEVARLVETRTDTIGVRVFLQMAAGATPASAIVAGVEHGLSLTGTLGFGENLATGDFSRGAYGIWIDDGALTYPVDCTRCWQTSTPSATT